VRVPVAHLLAYAVAALTAAMGGALLLGLVAPAAPRPFRLTLGVVLVLLAAYRVVVTRLHAHEE
jgi:hypothetical protein